MQSNMCVFDQPEMPEIEMPEMPEMPTIEMPEFDIPEAPPSVITPPPPNPSPLTPSLLANRKKRTEGPGRSKGRGSLKYDSRRKGTQALRVPMSVPAGGPTGLQVPKG